MPSHRRYSLWALCGLLLILSTLPAQSSVATVGGPDANHPLTVQDTESGNCWNGLTGTTTSIYAQSGGLPPFTWGQHFLSPLVKTDPGQWTPASGSFPRSYTNPDSSIVTEQDNETLSSAGILTITISYSINGADVTASPYTVTQTATDTINLNTGNLQASMSGTTFYSSFCLAGQTQVSQLTSTAQLPMTVLGTGKPPGGYVGLVVPLTVTITNESGNPVSGMSVAFNITQGAAGSSLTASTATTGADGTASTGLTLGSSPAPYQVYAHCGACSPPSGFLALSETSYMPIDSVEMTQAIQQFQSLADLKTSLSANNEPPVPIIAGKPGVMRVYLTPLPPSVAIASVNLTIPGVNVLNPTQLSSLPPGCTSQSQRYQSNPCFSTDFYFTPPTGPWTATLKVSDPQTGTVSEQEVLNFVSRQTQPLRLRAVSVCDSDTSFLCALGVNLLGQTSFFEKIAPLPPANVSIDVTNEFVRPAVPDCPDPTDLQNCNGLDWWETTVAYVNRLYTDGDAASDLLNNQRTTYYGMVLPGTPGAAGIAFTPVPGVVSPSHAAMSITSVNRFTSKTDVTQETIAHEIGHTFGLKHTFSGNPPVQAGPPGCYGFANDPSTDWPWASTQNNPGDNRIQSSAGLEVPFDVGNMRILNPNVTYEIESYCTPRWVAPQRYKEMIETLGGGVVTSPSSAPLPNTQTPSPRTVVTQAFWTVSGTLPSNGAPQFNPLFQSVRQGDTSGGSGSYSLVVENSSGAALFTQHFNPETSILDADGTAGTSGTDGSQGTPTFAQLLPVMPGAASIVLMNPSSSILGSITLGGIAPTVTITNPTAAFTGTGAINWTVTDPDSATFTSRVYYSTDNGPTWAEIGEVSNSGTSLNVDFTSLPGTNGLGLIRVLVSDGVNTGQATSANFSIAKKAPSLVQIQSPMPDFSQPAAVPVYFSGIGYDTDDGVLNGSSLAWSSNLQGALGTGSPLSVKLQPGVHTITLTATDSDHNSISTTTTVTIGDHPPTLQVSFNNLTTAPSNGCVEASVNAAPGTNGAPLSAVQFSIDGGNTYTNIPLNQLPLTFLFPGSGSVSAVFTATDTSNQEAAQSASPTISGACASLTVPNVAGLAQGAASTAITGAGLVVGTVTAIANNSIPAGNVIRQNPSSGTAISPGSSVAVSLVVSTGPSPLAACDVNSDGIVNVSDVQAAINQALGGMPAGNDLNGDKVVNVIDVQIVMNAVLGLGCA